MNTVHDYESLSRVNFAGARPAVFETYDGKSVVRWHGKIEGQVVGLLADAEKSRNFPYADKLREFLRVWRDNEITGSINRETLDPLKTAADMLAVDPWNLASYFRALRDELRVLIASEEELPRGMDQNQNDPYAGGGGGGRGGPPMSPDFGPQDSPPGGPGGPGGPGEGGPGAPGGPGDTGPGGPGGPGEGGPGGPGGPDDTGPGGPGGPGEGGPGANPEPQGGGLPPEEPDENDLVEL